MPQIKTTPIPIQNKKNGGLNIQDLVQNTLLSYLPNLRSGRSLKDNQKNVADCGVDAEKKMLLTNTMIIARNMLDMWTFYEKQSMVRM